MEFVISGKYIIPQFRCRRQGYLLDLDFNIAVAENKVPSTGEWSPHIHIFLQMPDGSWPGNKGAAFSTAGALLSLALNYRFLPIYEK